MVMIGRKDRIIILKLALLLFSNLTDGINKDNLKVILHWDFILLLSDVGTVSSNDSGNSFLYFCCGVKWTWSFVTTSGAKHSLVIQMSSTLHAHTHMQFYNVIST